MSMALGICHAHLAAEILRNAAIRPGKRPKGNIRIEEKNARPPVYISIFYRCRIWFPARTFDNLPYRSPSASNLRTYDP